MELVSIVGGLVGIPSVYEKDYGRKALRPATLLMHGQEFVTHLLDDTSSALFPPTQFLFYN